MKLTIVTGTAVVGSILAGLVGARPLGRYSARWLTRDKLLTYDIELKREIVTEVTFTTVTAAQVIVWVDENNVPYETVTVDEIETIQSTFTSEQVVQATPTSVQPAPASSATPSSSSTSEEYVLASPSVPIPESNPAVIQGAAVTTSAPLATASPSEAPQPSASPEPKVAASGDSFPIGVTYDPFKPGACKTEDEIRNEWSQMTKYGIVRIYGMGCGIIPLAIQLAKANNQKIFAGIFLSNGGDSEDIETVVQTISQAVKDNAGGDWNIIGMVSVENEQVNSASLTVSAVIDAINRGRSALRRAGYNGPVGAVETAPAMIDNPMICQNSDIAMVNIHAFFDSNTRAEDAGKFVQGEAGRVRDACGGKRVVITESGWPHQGDSHDQAYPSRINQKAAIDSLLSIFSHDLFLFNAFDSNWKTDWSGSFQAERFWGILSGNPT